MGLVDRIEVLKHNPEIFDKEGVIQRMSEIAQLSQQVDQLSQQNKELKGDLQTARRESVSDRKRVEVEKFKTTLNKTDSDAKANQKIQANKLANAVKSEVERLRPTMEDMAGGLGQAQEEFGTL